MTMRGFLRNYLRQSQSLGMNMDTPRHRFHFTIFTKDDQQILVIIFDNFPTSPQPRNDSYLYLMRDVTKSDICLHASSAYASSPAGRKMLHRCRNSGFSPTIHASSDTGCDDHLLETCDYIIDLNYINILEGLDRFWNNARCGEPQDNMLSNPKYRVSKHDISRKGLAGRTEFSIWAHNSGCHHGNDKWVCYGCGEKCKRGRCKVSPRPEREVPEAYKLPGKGSSEWRKLTSNELVRQWRLQHRPPAPGKWHQG